jgi:hypothetical protein
LNSKVQLADTHYNSFDKQFPKNKTMILNSLIKQHEAFLTAFNEMKNANGKCHLDIGEVNIAAGDKIGVAIKAAQLNVPYEVKFNLMLTAVNTAAQAMKEIQELIHAQAKANKELTENLQATLDRLNIV